jgi:hypothetical protein
MFFGHQLDNAMGWCAVEIPTEHYSNIFTLETKPQSDSEHNSRTNKTTTPPKQPNKQSLKRSAKVL